MNCPECHKPMQNLGNIDNAVYTSNPPQWDETYVCHSCKTKSKKRVMGQNIITPTFSDYKTL